MKKVNLFCDYMPVKVPQSLTDESLIDETRVLGKCVLNYIKKTKIINII